MGFLDRLRNRTRQHPAVAHACHRPLWQPDGCMRIISLPPDAPLAVFGPDAGQAYFLSYHLDSAPGASLLVWVFAADPAAIGMPGPNVVGYYIQCLPAGATDPVSDWYEQPKGSYPDVWAADDAAYRAAISLSRERTNPTDGGLTVFAWDGVRHPISGERLPVR